MSIYFLFQKQNCRLRQKKWPPTKRKKVSNRLKKIVNEYFQFEEKDAKYDHDDGIGPGFEPRPRLGRVGQPSSNRFITTGGLVTDLC